MEEKIKKLKQIYDAVVKKVNDVAAVFIGEFGEEFVDVSLYSFEEFLEWLDTQTLGTLGINKFTGENSSGKYHIDIEDYKINGKGRKFLDYIPDLGIIDYLRPVFIQHIREAIVNKNSNLDADSSYPVVAIMVRFPEVTVTNENDKSIQIKELYVRTTIGLDGCLNDIFDMIRTEYDLVQWISGYVHSHVTSIQRDHPEHFKIPCTGSGPINLTMSSLRRKCDLNLWSLYVFELAKYVTVESLSGIPYRRLEEVGADGRGLLTLRTPVFTRRLRSYRLYDSAEIRNFCIYFLKLGQMKFAYKNGVYTLGEDFRDFCLRVSKAFIEWHNNNVITRPTWNVNSEMLYNTGLLSKVIIAGSKIYNIEFVSRIDEVKRYEGKEMFMFKGEMKTLHFTENLGEYSYTSLIDITICEYILTLALQIVNYRYGRREEEHTDNSVNRKSCYI